MTARTPSTLREDVFVDPETQHTPPTVAPTPTTTASTLPAFEEINRRNVQSNREVRRCHDDVPDGRGPLTSRSYFPPVPIFETHTVYPPPPSVQGSSEDFSSELGEAAYSPSPLRNSLQSIRIDTDRAPPAPARNDSLDSQYGRLSSPPSGVTIQRKTSSSSLKPVSRTPSLKQHFSRSIGSAASSTYPSPVISAMGDVTPLPSPLLSSDSPGPWKRLSPPRHFRELALPTVMPESVLVTSSGESVASALANQSKRKLYAGLNVPASEQSSGKFEHARNRSISEYIPDSKAIPKRQVTVSGSANQADERQTAANADLHLRREPHLSEARGLIPATKPPTPPPSESSQSNDGSNSRRSRIEYFEAHGRNDQKLRRWRAVKSLGQGTFSRVVLATSQMGADDRQNTDRASGQGHTATVGATPDRKTLVAIKICEHGPRGGASEDRIEMSVKRELEIMQSISHPSLVHLRAWNIEPTRALLVLSYCPGGDLFDVATAHRDLLTSALLRRIFAELVGAVRYLHQRRIVHRDIKLENVLVNISPNELADLKQDWTAYPHPVITVTDLGLSRRVADDEKLETRCGSDDYAAPEVILGQPYDGRAIDAWSIGVLLYALIESRLPFDPPPGASDAQRMRSRTSHRIARVDWSWIKYGGDDGDHDADEAKFEHDGLTGAMEITEGLLKRARSRWPLDKVANHEWVKGGITVDGGIKFREEEDGEEVS